MALVTMQLWRHLRRWQMLFSNSSTASMRIDKSNGSWPLRMNGPDDNTKRFVLSSGPFILKGLILKGEKSSLFHIPRKKTHNQYDTAFRPYPNRPNIRSLHALVARRSSRSGSCVQSVRPAESHRGARAICSRSYGGLRGY